MESATCAGATVARGDKVLAGRVDPVVATGMGKRAEVSSTAVATGVDAAESDWRS